MDAGSMRQIIKRLPLLQGYSLQQLPVANRKRKRKKSVEVLTQAVLDARAKYPDSSLADLYDPLAMPPDLLILFGL